MLASPRLLRVLALVVASLALVTPNAGAPNVVAPGQPPSSRLRRSKLTRSPSEAGRDLQLLVEQTRGGEAKAEGGAETEQVGVSRIDRTRRGFYPRVYEAIPEAEDNGYGREELSAFCVQQVRWPEESPARPLPGQHTCSLVRWPHRCSLRRGPLRAAERSLSAHGSGGLGAA